MHGSDVSTASGTCASTLSPTSTSHIRVSSKRTWQQDRGLQDIRGPTQNLRTSEKPKKVLMPSFLKAKGEKRAQRRAEKWKTSTSGRAAEHQGRSPPQRPAGTASVQPTTPQTQPRAADSPTQNRPPNKGLPLWKQPDRLGLVQLAVVMEQQDDESWNVEA